MKPRKVIVTLELETDLPISTLRKAEWWQEGVIGEGFNAYSQVIQVQVNVQQKEK